MKGIVFREFIDMVESKFSLDTADAIIAASTLSTGGAYTSVGTYPHEEMVDLVSHLSKHTGMPVRDLLLHFGRHLFTRFAVVHPEHVLTYGSAFDLLRRLDGNIHVEVRKLYNDAELPSFTYEQLGDDSMVFTYSSHRKLADFAQGLIEGCIAHFGEPMRIDRVDLPEDQHGAHTRFTLSRTANAHA
ncbi:MAG: heme NO-binding domain-containing protein [Burkholderiaceae bacterium]|nr:heme NO-binding domain-containing protein [Burkholderiaceae bacterium]